MHGGLLRAPTLITKSRRLLHSPPMLSPMPSLATESAQNMGARAGASRATRGHAHRISQTPRPEHRSVVGFVNDAEGAKQSLAGHATAAAGERGVCAPRAAASAGSHEPLPRGSPQESGSA